VAGGAGGGAVTLFSKGDLEMRGAITTTGAGGAAAEARWGARAEAARAVA
jgi:hypothetical protein